MTSLVTQTWLESATAIRGILVEVTVYDIGAVANTTLYLSNVGYITTDASISYDPIIKGGVQFTESLSVEGSTSLSFGDIELSNHNGDIDDWIDADQYIWVNKSIKIYLGDPFWVCANLAAVHSNFELIFDGVVADIDAKSRESLNIKVVDKLQRLNTVLTETTLGTYGTWNGGQTNQETIKPIIFGEVFNVEPLLIDPSNLDYMFNNGNSELLIEIRDNGVPLYTHDGTSVIYNPNTNVVTLSTGIFRLGHPSVGTITVSAQGIKNSVNLITGAVISGTYSNNIANLIALIVTQYGTNPLVAGDLDLVNLAAFATANTQSVGTYITDKSNILTVCQELAGSIGAQLFMTRAGKLQLLTLKEWTAESYTEIADTDILHHSLSISSKTDVIASTKLGGCKNWTVQENLLTLIDLSNKEYFKDAWLDVLTTNSSTKTLYSLNALPEQQECALIVDSEIQAEANRRNAYFDHPHIVYQFTGTAKLMSLVLGSYVNLTHNRFNLSAGKKGQIISLSPNWLKSTIEVEVII